jgi:hypothetical protein
MVGAPKIVCPEKGMKVVKGKCQVSGGYSSRKEPTEAGKVVHTYGSFINWEFIKRRLHS